MSIQFGHKHNDVDSSRQQFAGLARRWLPSGRRTSMRYQWTDRPSSLWTFPSRRVENRRQSAQGVRHLWFESNHQYIPVASAIGFIPTATVEGFRSLVQSWRSDTEFVSSTTQMILHPSYQRIIGMGHDVIPLILQELQERPDHWFWALYAITGEDIVPYDASFNDAVRAWLDWGASRGYIEDHSSGIS